MPLILAPGEVETALLANPGPLVLSLSKAEEPFPS